MTAKEVMKILKINWFNSNNFISDKYKIKFKINNKINCDLVV